MNIDRLWQVTGTRSGKVFTVRLLAANHNEAVKRASHHPHMLVVRDVMLIDRAEDFPITLIGDKDHAAAQRATVKRLLRKA
jgi:hypothetical protein